MLPIVVTAMVGAAVVVVVVGVVATVAVAAATSVDFKLCLMPSNPEMCECILYLCVSLYKQTHLARYGSHPFTSLSLRLIYSSIPLYLQPNQTVKCRKQENFTINHC